MKNIFLILTAFLILTGCSSKRSDKRQLKDSIASTNIDTTRQDAPYYLKDTIRDLKNFAVKTNYPTLDKIIVDLNNNKSAFVTIKTDYCWGDACGAYKKLVDSTSKLTLFIFKYDVGEYGFGNDQFLFVDSTLSIVRNFNFGIEEWPTEKKSTVFIMTEEIYDFSKDKVVIKKRKKSFTDNNNYSINDIEFKTSSGDKVKLLKVKTEEFKKTLELENSKDE